MQHIVLSTSTSRDLPSVEAGSTSTDRFIDRGAKSQALAHLADQVPLVKNRWLGMNAECRQLFKDAVNSDCFEVSRRAWPRNRRARGLQCYRILQRPYCLRSVRLSTTPSRSLEPRRRAGSLLTHG